MNPNFPQQGSVKTAGLWYDDVTLSDEGGYFISTNPTVGTGIAQTICVDDAATASSTHAQFAPALMIFNPINANNPNAPSVFLRYIKLICTVAPASATAWKYSIRLDNANRFSSGGTAITPVNPNTGSAKSTAAAIVNFGAIVPTGLPANTSRLVANGTLDSAIPVVGDQYLLQFGAPAISMDQLNGGTTAKNMTFLAPPIVIAPGWCLALDMWGASNAATPASWEFEMGHVERVPGL